MPEDFEDRPTVPDRVIRRSERPEKIKKIKPADEGKSAARMWAETVVDVVAIAVAGALAWAGKVNGDFALFVIALLAGVRIMDLMGGRGGGPGGGLTALVLGGFTGIGHTAADALRRVGVLHG
jgi:uncharacterized membrane protein YbhN (UPF0104 family)